MSISSAADNTGSSLGAGVGGLGLLLFGYEGMAVSLGAMGIAAAIIFHLLAIDPTRTEKRQDSSARYFYDLQARFLNSNGILERTAVHEDGCVIIEIFKRTLEFIKYG